MKWQVFYDDGTHTNEVIRKDGVICIVQEVDGHHNIQNRKDFYILTDAWIGVDVFGLRDYVINHLEDIRLIVEGKSVSNKNFNDIFKTAKEFRF